jgi:uncharacterized protein YkwD
MRFTALILFINLWLPAAVAAQTCAAPGDFSALSAAVIQSVNTERAIRGLPALKQDPELSAAAQAHACDMGKRGYFSHAGRNGSTVMTRAKTQGYRACLIAENIALGQGDVAQVMASWIGSKGHRANILRRGVRDTGVGVALQKGRLVWVQVFAKPC